MENDNELSFVQFGIASAEQIMRQSVVDITSTDKFGDHGVYDERMGPLHGQQCKTCMQPSLACTGHFGHIVLLEPVPNPLFVSRLVSLCGIFCWHCSRRVVEMIPKIRHKRNESFLSVLTSKTRNIKCHACKMDQPIIFVDKNGVLHNKGTNCTLGKTITSTRVDTFELLKMLSKITIDDLTSIGLNVQHARPKDYMLTLLPVLPHMNRPYMVSHGQQTCCDDLTTLYCDVVKINKKALRLERKSEPYMQLMDRLTFTIRTLFNNSDGAATHPSSGRRIRGMAERMANKDGLFRSNIMGKRSDQTARAVAIPGPQMNCDQVGIPKRIAKILTRFIRCTFENIVQLQDMCDQNKVDIVERIVNGNRVEFGVARFCNQKQTRLHPGDVIMRDGQLPLRVFSGHEIIIDGDIIMRSGLTIVASPNRFRKFVICVGDGVSRYLEDGDLLLVNRQPTLHTGSMTAMNIIIHDGFGIALPLSVTHRLNADFDGDEINLHSVQSDEALNELKELAHASKAIVSSTTGKPFITLVQDTTLALYLMTKKPSPIDDDLLSIEEIERVNEVRRLLNIKNKICEEQNGQDTLALLSSCLPRLLFVNTNNIQIVCGIWVSGICDKKATTFLTNIVYNDFGDVAASTMISKLQHMAVAWLSRRGFTIDGNDVKPIDDMETISSIVEKMSQTENGRTIRDFLHHDAIKRTVDSNLQDCVISGAKGTSINIGQIVAVVGQQQGKSGFIDASLSHDRVVMSDIVNTSDSGFEKLCRSGFIVNSFASGLTNREYFLHSIPSRESIVNTATGTANSGYLQHRLVKIADDAVIQDGQVIYSAGSKKTLSLSYNGGLNPFAPRVNKAHELVKQKLTAVCERSGSPEHGE